MRFAWRSMMCLTLILAFVAGCRRSGDSAAGGVESAAAAELKTFPIRGKIVSVDAAKGEVLLDHEAVPGFMDAMTMSYKLKDPGNVSELHPGDRIVAKLLVRKTADGFEDPQLDEIVVTAQAKPDYKPTVQYHVPAAGDSVPDFKLLNENGRMIHLSQFKGQVVLLTFIYTRCPLVDFCPRMNKNFAQIDKALATDRRMYKQTHLLSISFDPEKLWRNLYRRVKGNVRALGLRHPAGRRVERDGAIFRLGSYAGRCGYADALNVDGSDWEGWQGAGVVSDQ